MTPKQRLIIRNVKENPDSEYMSLIEDIDIYYCRACLCTEVNVLRTGSVYCSKCLSYLTDIQELEKICHEKN